MPNHNHHPGILSNLIRCTLTCTLADTGILISGCGGDDGGGGSGVVANDLLIPNIAPNANNLTACKYNQNSSAFSHCNIVGDDTIYDRPEGIAITKGDNNQTLVLVSNINDDTVSSCPFNTSTGSLDDSSCLSTTAGSLLDDPADMTLAEGSNDEYALIANTNNGEFIRCILDTADVSLGSCNQQNGNGAFNTPTAIAIEEGNNSIKYGLAVNSGDDSLSKCIFQKIATSANLDVPADITFVDGDNNTTYALITNFDGDNISSCEFDPGDGNLINFSPAGGSSLQVPIGITTRNSNGQTYALIVNGDTNTVTTCQFDTSNGELNNCGNSGSNMNEPQYIDFVST